MTSKLQNQNQKSELGIETKRKQQSKKRNNQTSNLSLLFSNYISKKNSSKFSSSYKKMNINEKRKLLQDFLKKMDLDALKKENNNLKRRVPFTPEEDQKLQFLVNKYGPKNWSLISSFIENRTPKQCRDRYCNYLFQGNFQGEWSKEEDNLLIKLFKEKGPKWSIIRNSFPDRSTNSIKNRWNFFLCRQNDFILNINSDTNKISNEISQKIEEQNHDLLDKETSNGENEFVQFNEEINIFEACDNNYINDFGVEWITYE